MCGGSPPPPPDYSAQKGEIRRATEARYQQQANDYNTAVANYNNALSGYRNTLNDVSSNIGGMSIADLYDDPTTDVNENQFGNYMSSLNNVSSGLGGLSMDMSKPVFQSSVGSEYGTVGITNIPSLDNVNSNLYNQLTGNASSLQNQLNQLQKQREAEERRISDFRGNLLSDLSTYETGLNQLGISDLSQMNQLERDLSALNARRNSFSSSILNQMYPGGFNEVGSRYSNLMSGLDDLRNRRSAEEQRIANYEADLLGDVDSFRNTLGGYTIADEAGIQALQDQIDQRQRQAGRFSSELGFNFNDELGELSDVERQLGQLQRERTNELNRIASAQENYLNTARGIEQAAEGANIYSAAGLDAISDNLRDLRSDIGGFSSQLGYDFSGANTSLTEADAALAALREQRATAIDDIASGISGATQGLGDIALNDEAAIRERLSQLRDVEGQLAPFSGGRVNEIQSQINTGIESVNARLQELADYRAQLEQRAQTMLENVRNASYYATGDLGDDQASFDAIQAEAELYNAQQAMDEVDQIMTRLNSERQRLEADAEAVAARTGSAQERLLAALGTSGLPEFQDLSQVDPMTLQQYMALLQNEEEEDIPLGLSPTAFSNALGVIRAGTG